MRVVLGRELNTTNLRTMEHAKWPKKRLNRIWETAREYQFPCFRRVRLFSFSWRRVINKRSVSLITRRPHRSVIDSVTRFKRRGLDRICITAGYDNVNISIVAWKMAVLKPTGVFLGRE